MKIPWSVEKQFGQPVWVRNPTPGTSLANTTSMKILGVFKEDKFERSSGLTFVEDGNTLLPSLKTSRIQNTTKIPMKSKQSS